MLTILCYKLPLNLKTSLQSLIVLQVVWNMLGNKVDPQTPWTRREAEAGDRTCRQSVQRGSGATLRTRIGRGSDHRTRHTAVTFPRTRCAAHSMGSHHCPRSNDRTWDTRHSPTQHTPSFTSAKEVTRLCFCRCLFVMVALYNRETIYIFMLFLSSFFFLA